MSYRLARRAEDQRKRAIRKRAREAGFPAAERLERAFHSVFTMLADQPLSGEERTDLTPLPIRFFPCDVYWVVHKVEPSRDVVIVAIIDMRRQAHETLRRK
jgi:plasmid stabilization system protein ParE